MNDFQWKARQELTKQLKFFGAKKLTFISEYAKKPRILMSNKVKQLTVNSARESMGLNQLSALYQDQCNRGMQNSVFGFEQMAMANMAATGMGQAQFVGGLGGLAGMGSQLLGGKFI